MVLLAGSAATGERVLLEQAVAVADSLPRPVAWLLRLLGKQPVLPDVLDLVTTSCTTPAARGSVIDETSRQ